MINYLKIYKCSLRISTAASKRLKQQSMQILFKLKFENLELFSLFILRSEHLCYSHLKKQIEKK